VTPRATYRVQFSKTFTFDDAAEIAGYLADLGISHLYGSPCLTARAGSTHGYDVVDPSRINPELGGREGLDRLTTALRNCELSQIADFVPNHMAAGGADNKYWLDVLEWGPRSKYADWFDIDWDARIVKDRPALLVPFLGDQYGVELEAGRLQLRFDAATGSFAIWAYDTHKLPICPNTYGILLDARVPELKTLANAFSMLDAAANPAPQAATLKAELATLVREVDNVASAIQRTLAEHRSSWQRLDTLLRLQHWRAAYFRVAADDINYRRFFNINGLIAVRMENDEVFREMHRAVLHLLKNQTFSGLRIDHVDGLFDPKRYLQQLRQCMDAVQDDSYLVVEKIVAQHESLREDWPVDGTTGYDFASDVVRLLLDPNGQDSLDRTFASFAASAGSFAEVLRASKLHIVENEMASELHSLAAHAVEIASQSHRSIDFTRDVLERVLKQVVVCFPVYRTYVDDQGVSEEDDRDIHWAISQAHAHERDIDESVFEFVEALLSSTLAPNSEQYNRDDLIRFASRFQQYSAPVMAKGMEDTAFFRYPRLLALNDVGSRPDLDFGMSAGAFHKTNLSRQRHWPHTLLATSTHDSKLGEDARARLAVLSEIPEEWDYQVRAWTRLLRAGITGTEGNNPIDPVHEYHLYQLLIATFPPELLHPGALEGPSLTLYSDRLKHGMIKVIREGKMQSSWISPNTEYEAAAMSFLERALDIDRSDSFLGLFRPFVERIARLGIENSIVQTILKVTVPGVPDIFQGSELLNLNLMDPDNRRPVDFSFRAKTLRSLDSGTPHPCFADWRDGNCKMAILSRLLRFRKQQPQLFSDGAYRALDVVGPAGDRMIAFLRLHATDCMLVLAARFPASRAEDHFTWEGTEVSLPDDLAESVWINLLDGQLQERIHIQTLLRDFPGAVLVPR
jgi:(1->4)-alpha-D-glucan 1-alpha-D-glucosylmutase